MQNSFLHRLLYVYAAFVPCFVCAQSLNPSIIKIENGSFEGKPKTASIKKWQSCGFDTHTPFDVQPGMLGCTKMPYDGQTYIGMVTRSDKTFEWASQKLTQPLIKGQTYIMTLYATRSNTYKSIRMEDALNLNLTKNQRFYEYNFNMPCNLIVSGTNDECTRELLLANPVLVQDTNWQKINFKFKPTKDYKYLQLWATHYLKDSTEGNILLDNISDILPIDSITNLPTVYIPTIDTTEIQNRNIAEQVITKNMKYFFIEQYNYSIPKEWFYQHNKLFFGNKELTTLVRAFSKIPNTRLIIRLKNEAFDNIDEWKIILYRYFQNNFRLDKTKISIEKYTKEDKLRKLLVETAQLSIFIE